MGRNPPQNARPRGGEASLRWNGVENFDVIQITMKFLANSAGGVALLLCMSAALAPAAQAQVPASARGHFQRGSEHYRKGQFDQAVREFSAAYETYPSARLIYDVAQAERKQGLLTDAARHYEQFLKQEKAITPLTRGVVQSYLQRLRATAAGRKPPLPPRNMPDLFDPALGAPLGPGAGSPSVQPASAPSSPPVAPPAMPAVAASPSGQPPSSTAPARVEQKPAVAVAAPPSVAPVAPSAPPPPAPAAAAAGPTPSYGIVRLQQGTPVATAVAPSKPISGRWLPVPVNPSFTLRDVAVQGDALFAVGDGGIFFVALQDGIFRAVRSGVNNWLSGVWGVANELFMTGDSGTILRRFGGRMKPVASGTTKTLFAIGGTANDWFAVGEAGVAVRWNGSGFAPVPTGTRQPLFAVQALDGEVFASGGGGLILRWNGAAFVPMESGTSSWLHALWGTSRSDVFAVGARGTILHFDGRAWTQQASGTNETLLAIWGTASDRVVAVGSRGTILHYHGGSWRPAKSGTQASLFGVVGRDADTIYAIGDAGTVLRLQPE